jgi:hypothetical protein
MCDVYVVRVDGCWFVSSAGRTLTLFPDDAVPDADPLWSACRWASGRAREKKVAAWLLEGSRRRRIADR